jgi:hypothetical protein
MVRRGFGRRQPRPTIFCRTVIASLVIAACLTGLGSPIALAQADAEPDEPDVHIIHGSPAVGAVDLYIDGALVFVGLTFAAVSDPIPLAAGGRTVTIVPSGRSSDEALLETSVILEGGSVVDLVLLGPAENPSIGVYPVDLTPLPPELTRLGVVLGAIDTGPVDVAVTGGDLLYPTLEYAAATEFADISAGAYDLEVRYGGTDAVALALPGSILEAGNVYRLYIVGEAAIGQLQPMLVSRPAAPVVIDGHPAWVQAGDCGSADPARAVAELTIVAASPFADAIGHPAAAQSRSSFTTIDVALDTLTATAHSIAVAESEALVASVISCGEVGGTPSNDGSLVVGLRQAAESETAGMAVLSPNVLDPTMTDVSVFLAAGLHAGSNAVSSDATGSDAATDAAPIVAAPIPETATPAATPVAVP